MTLTAMTMNPRECSRLEIRMENEVPKRGITTDIVSGHVFLDSY